MSMIPHDVHLDERQRDRILDGQLSPDEEASLVRHLDECWSCRELLDAAAGGLEWSSEARRYLSLDATSEFSGFEGSQPASRAGDADAADESPLPGLSLDFLAPSDDPAMLGRVGVYEIAGVIGRGGAGIVLKAFERSLNRFVAVKVLAPHLAASAAARKRFEREAKAAAAVVHENIVPIYSVDEHRGLPFIVMQYVPGRSLHERLERQGPLGLKEVLRIGLQTAAGLAAAHAQGLVHRDIKPANILLEHGVERVLLADFGLARAFDDASLTCSSIVAGTPQYMAPEQARGEAIDHRTDLFSLGSLMYAMCAGHSPFRAETTMGVLHRLCVETPRPLRQINADVPEWLERIIRKLHSKHPARRYQSAAEVAELLAGHLARLQNPGAAVRDPWWQRWAHRSVDWWADLSTGRRVGTALGGLALMLVAANLAGLSPGIRSLAVWNQRDNEHGTVTADSSRGTGDSGKTGRAQTAGSESPTPGWDGTADELIPVRNLLDQSELAVFGPWQPRRDPISAELRELQNRLGKLERELPERGPAVDAAGPPLKE